ncbi:MAG: Maf family protein, partial [Steroidobacteraceae bacterium]|nr:Maf family protein [Steroidobacteraceae bacterium]
MFHRPLILASTSPYRRALLARLGLPFVVESPGTDETATGPEAPAARAARLARAKALAVARRHPDAI